MKTIPVTDDHADTNEVMCRFLRSRGYRTVSAFTGEAALAVIATDRPDLLILDASAALHLRSPDLPHAIPTPEVVATK